MKKIAIVRLSAMGDIVHTLASFQFIKSYFKDIEITWFVEEKFAEILKNSPHIDKITTVNISALKKEFSFSSLKKIYKTVKNSGDFDLIIDIQGLLKSAILARVAGKNVAGLDSKSARESLSSLFYNQKFEVDCSGIAPMRFASLLSQTLNIEITKEMMLQKLPYLYFEKDANIDDYFKSEKKSILIITGASNESKTYPAEKFAEVANLLENYNVLLIAGSKKERESAKIIEQNSSARLIPTKSLNSLKYTVSKCDLLIGGDTGPSHIAWAMNKPSVILFGSTPRTMMMETPINVAITSGAKVHPCRFDKSDRSIATIDPKSIAKKVKALINDK